MHTETGIIFRLKKLNILRIIAWPIINVIRLWRRLFYRFTRDAKKVRSLHKTHAGERCFIIGNGPSLTVADLEKLGGECCFAANRIFELFPFTKWRPDYYFCVDSFVLSENRKQIVKLELPNIFIHLEGKKYKVQKSVPSVVYINNYYPFMVKRHKKLRNIHISEDISKYFYCGETVTFTAIQMAIYMGFKEIYLLGVDNHYSRRIDSKGNFEYNHQIKDYFGDLESRDYNIQTYETTEAAYRVAKAYCEDNAIKIYNATRGGQLEVFERIDFDRIVEQ